MKGPAHSYHIKEDNSTNLWVEDMFEGLVEFSKESLKDGMVVELHNGDKYTVMSDKLVSCFAYISLDKYNEKLENVECSECSIDKVYKSNALIFSEWTDESNLSLVWENNSCVRVGDFVKVIDVDKSLPLGIDWLQANVKTFAEQLQYDVGHTPDSTHKFFVKAIAESSNSVLGNSVFAYIEDEVTRRCYIVDIEGLQKI